MKLYLSFFIAILFHFQSFAGSPLNGYKYVYVPDLSKKGTEQEIISEYTKKFFREKGLQIISSLEKARSLGADSCLLLKTNFEYDPSGYRTTVVIRLRNCNKESIYFDEGSTANVYTKFEAAQKATEEALDGLNKRYKFDSSKSVKPE